MKREEFLNLARDISQYFSNIPRYWDGGNAILEMKISGYRHWKQMEWIGWYFQFLCEKLLHSCFQLPRPRYGNVEFDGLYNIPWILRHMP